MVEGAKDGTFLHMMGNAEECISCSSFGMQGCFASSSTVQTPNGIININSLRLNDSVLTFTPGVGAHYTEVTIHKSQWVRYYDNNNNIMTTTTILYMYSVWIMLFFCGIDFFPVSWLAGPLHCKTEHLLGGGHCPFWTHLPHCKSCHIQVSVFNFRKELFKLLSAEIES